MSRSWYERCHWQAKSRPPTLLNGSLADGEKGEGMVGEHNMHNGLMATAAARHAGVALADAANALGSRLTLVTSELGVVKEWRHGI